MNARTQQHPRTTQVGCLRGTRLALFLLSFRSFDSISYSTSGPNLRTNLSHLWCSRRWPRFHFILAQISFHSRIQYPRLASAAQQPPSGAPPHILLHLAVSYHQLFLDLCVAPIFFKGCSSLVINLQHVLIARYHPCCISDNNSSLFACWPAACHDDLSQPYHHHAQQQSRCFHQLGWRVPVGSRYCSW